MSEEVSFLFEEEGGIDPERIVNDEHYLANEFFCSICQGLLWKSKSCASCQHLFCSTCIRTWLQVNPTSCPFRCSPYEEKRPPPYIYSLLGRLSIRCRNSSFGCTEILSYDALEQHERVECQFPTKRCGACRKYILAKEIDEHQASCVSATVQCLVCKHPVDRSLLSQHLNECFRERLNLLIDEMMPLPDDPGTPTNGPLMNLQEQGNENWLTQFNARLLRFLSTLPQNNLIGFEEMVQAREQKISTRIWTMSRLIWLNKSRTIQILFPLFCFGIGFVIGFLLATYFFIQRQVDQSIYRTFAFIILCSGLFNFILPLILDSTGDALIILLAIVCLLLCGSVSPILPLEYFQVRQSSKLILVIYVLALITFEVFLLMLRLYFWYIPSYISAGCLAWLTMFITFHIRRFSLNRRRIILM